jgi:hypothetical protein
MYGIFSVNNSLFIDFVSSIFLLEFDLIETNNTGSSIDEDDPTNIQVKTYTLQKRNPGFSSTLSVSTSNQEIPPQATLTPGYHFN